MNKKKLKKKLRLAEARLYRLEQHIQELETHTYGAVSDDVERLHQQVDMWADTPLKSRVAALEGEADEVFGEFNKTFDAFDALMEGLDDAEEKRIRSVQRTPTESIPAWLLAKRSDGSFYLNRYYVPDGEDLAIGEQMFEVTTLDQLEDLVQYIQDTLAVTGWDEGQL